MLCSCGLSRPLAVEALLRDLRQVPVCWPAAAPARPPPARPRPRGRCPRSLPCPSYGTASRHRSSRSGLGGGRQRPSRTRAWSLQQLGTGGRAAGWRAFYMHDDVAADQSNAGEIRRTGSIHAHNLYPPKQHGYGLGVGSNGNSSIRAGPVDGRRDCMHQSRLCTGNLHEASRSIREKKKPL